MTKKHKKHKHLKVKMKIAGKILDKAEAGLASITIGCDDFCDAFGMSLEEMTEYMD